MSELNYYDSPLVQDAYAAAKDHGDTKFERETWNLAVAIEGARPGFDPAGTFNLADMEKVTTSNGWSAEQKEALNILRAAANVGRPVDGAQIAAAHEAARDALWADAVNSRDGKTLDGKIDRNDIVELRNNDALMSTLNKDQKRAIDKAWTDSPHDLAWAIYGTRPR